MIAKLLLLYIASGLSAWFFVDFLRYIKPLQLKSSTLFNIIILVIYSVIFCILMGNVYLTGLILGTNFPPLIIALGSLIWVPFMCAANIWKYGKIR